MKPIYYLVGFAVIAAAYVYYKKSQAATGAASTPAPPDATTTDIFGIPTDAVNSVNTELGLL